VGGVDGISGLSTHRAAFGGTLAARELGFGEICVLPLFLSMVVCGDACQWPYIRWCLVPDCQRGPRGFDLVIGDSPCRVFPAWC
jgi:hypothetical protein